MSRLVLTPISLRDARWFVDQHHRHHQAPQGGKFAVAVALEGEIVGVAIVGRPVALKLDDGWTAEVTRVCTLGHKNACSKLYGAAWRAARGMGYRRLVTYTLKTEAGKSLEAAGWTCIGEAGGGSWNNNVRARVDKHPTQKKLRWEREAI